MTGLSRDARASGKFDAVFPCHEVSRFADQASVGKSLLDGNKGHLLDQTRSERICELYGKTSATSLWSKIGIGKRP